MIVLGIDPGTAITGYGVVRSVNGGNNLSVIDYGCVRTEAGTPMYERLSSIYSGICGIIEKHGPEIVAIEQLFFNKNVRTALAVGQARGVAMLSAANSGLRVAEYTPLQVKQSVTGYGRAGKAQVQKMVKILLNLTEIPKPDDVADALAIAICHGCSSNLNGKIFGA